MRTIQAIYLSDGTLHMWMEMGAADALPNTMVLHIGDDVVPLADAQHIDHDANSQNPRLHWYRWPAGQHEVDWTGGELVGIWLEGPREQRLPAAPTALTATPVPGGVSLQWEAPNDGGSPILEYEYQQRDDTGVHGRFWWSTEGTAATYTVRRLRPQRTGRGVDDVGAPGDERIRIERRRTRPGRRRDERTARLRRRERKLARRGGGGAQPGRRDVQALERRGHKP